jgi:hypothetical protein
MWRQWRRALRQMERLRRQVRFHRAAIRRWLPLRRSVQAL